MPNYKQEIAAARARLRAEEENIKNLEEQRENAIADFWKELEYESQKYCFSLICDRQDGSNTCEYPGLDKELGNLIFRMYEFDGDLKVPIWVYAQAFTPYESGNKASRPSRIRKDDDRVCLIEKAIVGEKTMVIVDDVDDAASNLLPVFFFFYGRQKEKSYKEAIAETVKILEENPNDLPEYLYDLSQEKEELPEAP